MKIPNKKNKPQALHKGDLVTVIAPSSPFEREFFLKGIESLKNFGLKIVFRSDIFSKTKNMPYLAGDDLRRSEEFLESLQNPSIKAIFFARGGYGAIRLIHILEKAKIKASPKIIAGLSDTTVLQLYLQKRFGWPVFYAPVVGGAMGQIQNGFSKKSLLDHVFANRIRKNDKIQNLKVLNPGVAEAELAGGCLTLLSHSIGTPFEVNTDGKILFLEDVHEKPYQIDRYLMHLKLAGKFKKAKAVIVGSMAGPNPVKHYAETIRDVLSDFAGPVVMNFPSGHLEKTLTLPMGCCVRLDTKSKTLFYLERGVLE